MNVHKIKASLFIDTSGKVFLTQNKLRFSPQGHLPYKFIVLNTTVVGEVVANLRFMAMNLYSRWQLIIRWLSGDCFENKSNFIEQAT